MTRQNSPTPMCRKKNLHDFNDRINGKHQQRNYCNLEFGLVEVAVGDWAKLNF